MRIPCYILVVCAVDDFHLGQRQAVVDPVLKLLLALIATTRLSGNGAIGRSHRRGLAHNVFAVCHAVHEPFDVGKFDGEPV